MALAGYQSTSASKPKSLVSTPETLRALEEYCASLEPGDRIPTHTELMRRFSASERSVRQALDELQRSGHIVRRNGVGTFVAQRSDTAIEPAPSRTIVAVTRPDRAFFDRCMDLLFRQAEAAGFNLVCQPVDSFDVDPTRAGAAISSPLGYLLFGYRFAPLAKQLFDSGQRVVIMGAPAIDEIPEVPCIYNDHQQGGYLATSHLVKLGHRHLAFLHAGAGLLQQQRRWLGHQRALQEARRAGTIVTDSILEEDEVGRWEADPERAAAFFRAAGAPTGIVAWNDHEAARLLATLTRAGIRVPREVSLVGYDGLPEGSLVYPRLTTVDHGIGQQLQAAVELLTRRVPPPSTHTIVVMPALVSRESSAAPWHSSP